MPAIVGILHKIKEGKYSDTQLNIIIEECQKQKQIIADKIAAMGDVLPIGKYIDAMLDKNDGK